MATTLATACVARAQPTHASAADRALAIRALAMSEDERAKIDKIAAWYEKPGYPLPMTGQRITHNHAAAFAAITLFEGQVRPLARTRRRATKHRPAIFDEQSLEADSD